MVMVRESMNKLVCLASEAQKRRLPRLFRSMVGELDCLLFPAFFL